MDYENFFRQELDGLRTAGNYRVFANLQRQAGSFPRATHMRPATATGTTKSPSGARTTISAWASTPPSSTPCTKRWTPAAPAPAAPATSPAPTTTTSS